MIRPLQFWVLLGRGCRIRFDVPGPIYWGLMKRLRTKLPQLLIAILLVLAIACAEFPELTQLRDDTSNDFPVSSIVASHVIGSVAAPAAHVSPNCRIVGPPEFPPPTERSSDSLPPRPL